jgi:hypothetical protein
LSSIIAPVAPDISSAAVREPVIVEPARPARWAPSPRVVMLATLAISAGYVAWHLRRGWMPYDDGAMAQSAERLLQGELPHRDFDDIYTGGLSYLNAAAFRVFGTNLWSMRIALFAVFLAWVPTVFAIGRRFVRPLTAAAITLLAVAWSLPNYSAAMPSWYNLFLATFGAAALLRNVEDGRARWLVLAGVAGGLSILVKIVGLYYVAGVLLYLVFRAHALARAQSRGATDRSTGYALFVTAAVLAFVAALVVLVRKQFHAPELAQFVMPSALIGALLVRNEWSEPAGRSRLRFAGLARLLAPFLIGVTLPVALFLVPYLRSGSVGALVNGVFVLPMKRFGIAVIPVLPLWMTLACVPAVALAFLVRKQIARRPWVLVTLGLVLTAIFVVTGRNGATYRTVWFSVQNVLPLLAIAGVAVLWRVREADAEDPLLRQRLMALLCVMALCNLVQFPYFVANYFCYVAPLVLLATVALAKYLRTTSRVLVGMVMAFYLAFAVGRANRTTLYTMAVYYRPYLPTTLLDLPRGGIEVPTVHAEVYLPLIQILQDQARGGYTWASPDMPEVYFLSGLKNPTRSLFDFFDDPTNRSARILSALDSHGVTAIVLNRLPAFSAPLADDLIPGLEKRYPYSLNVGPYQLRWRK